MKTDTSPDPTQVRIELPRSLEFVPMARVAVAGYATRLGFDIDEVEDTRIAIDELTSMLVDHGDGTAMSISFRTQASTLLIDGATECTRTTDQPSASSARSRCAS